MPIKKTKMFRKSKKRSQLIKKLLSLQKTQKNKMSSRMGSKMGSKMRSHSRSKSNLKPKRAMKGKMKHHRGGFSSSCNMATVKEPGFSVDALGSIAGINIPSSSAAIYRPNCKKDSYQAMVL